MPNYFRENGTFNDGAIEADEDLEFSSCDAGGDEDSSCSNESNSCNVAIAT